MQQEQLQDKTFNSKGALWPFLKRIMGYTVQQGAPFWCFIAGITVVAAVDAVYPIVWLNFIDDVITPAVQDYANTGIVNWELVQLYGLYFLGLGTLLALGVMVFVYFAGYLQEHVMYNLRDAMFSKLQTLSFSYFDKSAMGWLISRITSDTEKVTQLISWGLLSLIWGLAMIAGCFIAMFIYHWQLACMVLAVLPILFIVSIKIRVLILKYSRDARKYNSEITATYNEHINGVEVNKTTVQEQRVISEFEVLSTKMQKASYRAAYFSSTFFPITVMTGSLATALIIYFGGTWTLSATAGLTLGTLAAFFAYSRMIFEPIADITRFYAMAQSSLSAGERVFELLDEVPTITDSRNAIQLEKSKGAIEYRNVTFGYESGKNVLEDFSIKINPGERVAIVGPTGEGKTTITNLLARFYEPQAGEILIDDTPIQNCTLESLRNQMGIILQTPHLFAGSIAENIAMGLQVDDLSVISALKLIGADSLSEKIHDDVGEEGGKLSLGERQMIAFARVIVRNPAILIMDEATSAVDTLTEQKIQAGVERITQNRTSIIIAHRLSTIKSCDRIIVIQKGNIIESGSHDELMKNNGPYHQLHQNQALTIS